MLKTKMDTKASEELIVEGSSAGRNPVLKEGGGTYTARECPVSYAPDKFANLLSFNPANRPFYDVCAEYTYKGSVGRVTPDVLPVRLPGVYEATHMDGHRVWGQHKHGVPTLSGLNNSRVRGREYGRHQTGTAFGGVDRHKHVTHHQQYTAEHAFSDDTAFEPAAKHARGLSFGHRHGTYHSAVVDTSYGDSVHLRRQAVTNYNHGVAAM